MRWAISQKVSAQLGSTYLSTTHGLSATRYRELVGRRPRHPLRAPDLIAPQPEAPSGTDRASHEQTTHSERSCPSCDRPQCTPKATVGDDTPSTSSGTKPGPWTRITSSSHCQARSTQTGRSAARQDRESFRLPVTTSRLTPTVAPLIGHRIRASRARGRSDGHRRRFALQGCHFEWIRHSTMGSVRRRRDWSW